MDKLIVSEKSSVKKLPGEKDEIFSLSIDAVSKLFSADIINGLTSAEVSERKKLYGLNLLKDKKDKNLLVVLLSQFQNIVVYILLFASIVSFGFNDYTEGFAILLVVVVNALIGFGMEFQAIRSMNALKKLDKTFTRVWRDGNLMEVLAHDIVPGDVLYFEAGDMISVDARIISLSQLEVNESSLTGESLPVIKNINVLSGDTILADRKNMLYKGTPVTKGNCKAIATATGMNTELGKISELVQSARKDIIPLTLKINSLSKKLIVFTVLVTLPLILLGISKGTEFVLLIETSIALIVSAIPEGLPIVSTIAFARGMLELAKHNVIIKKLAAVETLGSVSVIFTDKTGTLTQNRLEATVICIPDQTIDVEWNEADRSVSYSPSQFEEFTQDNLIKLFHVAALCNNASFTDNTISVGDPLEVALLKLGEYHRSGFLENANRSFPRIYEQPFDSETKIMETIHESEGKNFVAVKGAVEEVLKHSTFIFKNNVLSKFSEENKKEWLNKTDELAKKGLKVLAFAYKDHTGSFENSIRELNFAGLVGFLDLPRDEVPQAIKECMDAGVRVVMVTGDHSETAKSIALKIGLTNDPDERVIHGKDLKALGSLTEKDQNEILNTLIFSRLSPSQKLDIISLYQKKNWITAMTGDGVNDAPALTKADIGIAMGKRGTQVAREAADMVLQDDSFASIVKAIKFGRVIYNNIRTFIIYLLSCNLSEIFVVAIAGFFSLALPLEPLQILFLNLVTDVFPALALGVNAGSWFVMKQKPRDSAEPILDAKKWISIIVYAVAITISVLSVFVYGIYVCDYSSQVCNNIAFFSLAFAQLFHPLNLSPVKESFFKNEITRNVYLWMAIAFCIATLFLVYFISPLNSVLSITKLDDGPRLLIFIGSTFHIIILQLLKRTKIIE